MECTIELFELHLEGELSEEGYSELVRALKEPTHREALVGAASLENLLSAVQVGDLVEGVLDGIGGHDKSGIESWVDRWTEGELSEEESRELLARMEDEGFKSAFVEAARFEMALTASFDEDLVPGVMTGIKAGLASSEDLSESVIRGILDGESAECTLVLDEEEEAPSSNVLFLVARVALPVAAVLALLAMISPEKKTPYIPAPVAMENSVGPIGFLAHLSDGGESENAEPLSWTLLEPGVIRLEDGLTRIDFEKGPSMTLRGPAEFEVVDASYAKLHSGILTARAGKGGGFKLEAESLELVDLGSSFGISVSEEGVTDLVAFEGEMEILERMKEQAILKKLTAGNAMRGSADSGGLQPVPFNTHLFESTWPVTAGVLSSKGAFKFAAPGPWRLAEYEDDENVVIFPERQRVVLKKPLKVDIAGPGRYSETNQFVEGLLPEGTQVRSYLFQFNPIGRPQDEAALKAIGRIRFERPILGVIVDRENLRATDRLLGVRNARYGVGDRGLESTVVELGERRIRLRDMIILSKDMKTLRLDLREAGSVDQIRVLVDAGSRAKLAANRKKKEGGSLEK